MDGTRSREGFSEFLDYLADKGLMAKATAQARKAAGSKILGILDENEAKDVTSVDVDDLIARFGRLHGKNYTPQSLTTYASRLRSGLDDFRAYLDNPLAFRPSTPNRERTRQRAQKEPIAVEEVAAPAVKLEPARSASPVHLASSNIMPVPIRADLTVYIQGLPFDLSEAEARKISGVITAMAQL